MPTQSRRNVREAVNDNSPLATIRLDADKRYTVREVTEIVKQALTVIGNQSSQIDLEYSSADVYVLLRNILNYVNTQIKGEFLLKRLRKGCWKIEHTPEKLAKRKADQRHQRELKRTANYLQELTGHRPPWG